jgi:subfamily B ATP-binding cassette protein MsbA
MVAIVGASGAGKSTLADLFLRFYDPLSGQITIDGVDIRDFKISSLRSKIGFVAQDTFLFNDTVEANICYGANHPSEEEIVEAAKIANAHDFITKLPKGYQTIIGERGVKLSGGQRQRLALIRAIIKKPQILILDEATSHLDSESERLIQESIKEIRRKSTVIAIAHRLSTIENADRIVVLDGGVIVEEGKHEDLLKKGKTYSKYFNLQFRERNKY